VWGPAVAQMGVIFFISSLAQPPLPEGISDHTGHSIGYAILGVLVLRALAGAGWAGVSLMRGVSTVAFCTLYGMSDEWHQSFVPGRTAAWDDVAADVRGALLGAAFVLILHIINKLWPTKI
jgi:VanZ family protein